MLLTLWQTIVLALIQGVTELFPISSLGHTVIIPAWLGWGDLNASPAFLPLITALHLGTSVALIIYFWRDWLQVGKTLVVTVQKPSQVRRGTDEWVSWLIIVGTIPAGLLGVVLSKNSESLCITSIGGDVSGDQWLIALSGRGPAAALGSSPEKHVTCTTREEFSHAQNTEHA